MGVRAETASRAAELRAAVVDHLRSMVVAAERCAALSGGESQLREARARLRAAEAGKSITVSGYELGASLRSAELATSEECFQLETSGRLFVVDGDGTHEPAPRSRSQARRVAVQRAPIIELD